MANRSSRCEPMGLLSDRYQSLLAMGPKIGTAQATQYDRAIKS